MVAISIIDNRKPNTLYRELRESLRLAKDVAIAVPFLDMKGLNHVLPSLEGKRRVRIIVGVSKDAFNDPTCLQTLFKLHQKRGAQFKVRIAKVIDRLHEKIYLVSSNRNTRAFVGSSNLTHKGLTGRSEVTIGLVGGSRDSVIRRLWEYFESVFNLEAVDLTSAILRSYKRIATKARKQLRPHQIEIGRELARLRRQLGTLPSEAEFGSTGRVWYDVLRGQLSASEERAVEKELGWKSSYFACEPWRKEFFGRLMEGDRIIFLDKTDKRGTPTQLRLQGVLEKGETHKLRWRHFVRERQIETARWNKTTMEVFRKARIYSNRGGKLLTSNQVEILSGIFRKTSF